MFSESHWAPSSPIEPHWAPLSPIEPHWAPLSPIEPHWAPLSSIEPHWAPLSPNWAPLSPNWAPLSPNWALLSPNWALLSPNWALLSPIELHWENSHIILKFTRFEYIMYAWIYNWFSGNKTIRETAPSLFLRPSDNDLVEAVEKLEARLAKPESEAAS